jgi:arylsulfatase A-like enzyme
VRQERLKRQVEMGITPAGTQVSERMWFVPDATLLAPASRALLGKKMELYAGMVENMDHHVGRLIDHLKKIGEYENTIFVVFGDNGAEGTDLFKMIAGTPGTRDFLWAAINWSQTHPNAWGDPGSYVAYGPMWAQVSMTPFSQYKGWLAEGGIRNALIVSGPGIQRAKGSINHGVMHVADLMPTMLEVAGAAYPKTLAGRELPPLLGKSWGPVLAGKAESPRTDKDYLAWQLFGNRAVRQGSWKLRWQYKPLGKGDWELVRPGGRPGRAQGSRRKASRQGEGDGRAVGRYARTNNVVLPSRGPFETLDDQLPRGCRTTRASRRWSTSASSCRPRTCWPSPSLDHGWTG